MARTKKKPEQTNIPGTEPPRIPEVDAAASAYLSIRDDRRALLEDQREAKRKLVEAMKKSGQLVYRNVDENILVTLETEDKVKVKREKDASDDDGDEE